MSGEKITFPKSNHLLMENFVLRWLGRKRGKKDAHMPLKLLHLVWGKMSCDLPA